MGRVHDYISSFLDVHQEYKTLCFYCNSNKDEIESFYGQHYKINNENGYDLVVVNYLDTDEIINVISKHSFEDFLILVDENADILRIWEAARSVLRKFYIVKTKNDVYRTVTEWSGHSNDIELSVILPVYNVGKFLRKCLDSITAWDAPYVEFLLVNDGSTDNSVEIINEYSKKDSRVKLINKKNGGCASARNAGLDNATGRYVGFVDPDDFVDETMFKKLLTRAIDGNVDIVWCGFNEYYEQTGNVAPANDIDYTPYLEPIYEKSIIKEFIAIRKIAIWRGIYKREMLINNNIRFHEELRRFDDLPFKVETFAVAKSICAINEWLYYYRLEREGQDVSANDEKLFTHFDIFNILDNFIIKFNDPRMVLKYEIVKIDTHLWGLSKIKKELFEEYKTRAIEDIYKFASEKEIKLLVLEHYPKEMRRQIRKYFIK